MNFDRLYEVGFQFKKTKIWKKLFDNDIFAVKLDDGNLAYVGIMGRLREYCAIGIYVGEEGYRSFKTLLEFHREMYPSEYKMHEAMVSQKCYHLSLEGKDEMDVEELKQARSYAKSHGIRLGGKNAYPRFLKYQPNCLPWNLTSQEDESCIYQAASATLRMAELLEEMSYREIGFDIPDQFPLLVCENGTYELSGSVKAPELKEIPYAKATNINEYAFHALKRCEHKVTLECELVLLPTPIQDDPNEAPYFPYTLMTVEQASEFIFPPNPLRNYQEDPERFVSLWMQSLRSYNVCPNLFLVRDQRTYDLLQDLAKKLQATIKIEPDLPALDEAQESFLRMMKGGEDEEAIDDIIDFIEMILSMDEDEIEMLPPEIVAQVEMLYDSGMLPEEVEMMLEDLFGF